MIEKICTPALLYVAFSITHVIIDTFKGLYNTAMTKFLVMIIFTAVLNILCQSGLGFISWIIVFIPFIMMSIITTMILFSLGLSPSSGKLKREDTDKSNKVVTLKTKKDTVEEPKEYNSNQHSIYEDVVHKDDLYSDILNSNKKT